MVVFGVTLFALSGLVFGSFGNVLLHRIHTKEPITGRSKCPSCHRILAWVDLFPILSFLVLRGKCRRCSGGISIRYPLVELGSGLLFVFAFLLHPADPAVAIITAFILYLLFLACIFDANYQQIPDIFTILIGVLALLSIFLKADSMSLFLGATVMLVWFGGQWVITRGKAVGTGDIFIAIVLGLWLGIRSAIMTLVFSYMSGAIILIIMILFRKISAKQQRVAFVPFLTLGVLLTLLGFGEVYLRIIGF